MTATTFKKGIAVFCFLFGIVLFVVGGYYLWNTPIEHGWEGVVAIAAGFLFHTVFFILWR